MHYSKEYLFHYDLQLLCFIYKTFFELIAFLFPFLQFLNRCFFKSFKDTEITFISSGLNSFIIDQPVADLTRLFFSFSLSKLNLIPDLKSSYFMCSYLTLENLDLFLLRGHNFILLLNFDVVFIAVMFKLVVFKFHCCQLTGKVVKASLKVFFLDQDVGELILVFVFRCNSAYRIIISFSAVKENISYLLVGV